MVSRKWLYSYRILLARLREGIDAPATRSADLNGVSEVAGPRSLPVNTELPESNLAEPALRLSAGGKIGSF